MEQDYVVDIENLTIRFNLASEKISDLKEYFIKLVKRELMFQEFLALQDVTLKVRRGESWGLIGVNGSGKSTLLKSTCGILKPYKGSIKINGNIAPLIELGAGFDYNMTARENIFLNGTVLGHSRKFMQEHFEEIVDFAELHEFLDVPIKNFSSGMQARLGFAIATMVRPDILVVDEILSVGDIKFRQKSYEKIKSLMQEGVTVLLVSHSISQIRNICDKCIWIENGRVYMEGDCEDVCEAYIKRAKK